MAWECGEAANISTTPGYFKSWQLTSYADDAGLGQQRVFDIAFEPDGVVWLAADNGLHRFDGFTWSRFGTNEGLPSGFVRAVLVTKQGRLWVGTDKGAGIFDVARLKFDSAGSESGLANSNVRQIDEDPDGTLWFSCDQWPDSQVKPGGLSSLRDGTWQTFSRTNGLPMDYVIGYFRDSTGRQFAMTPHGWRQRRGELWEPPANAGYEVQNLVLQMAEAKDGTLFAQGEYALLTLNEGRWQQRASNLARLLCRTRAGELMAMEYDHDLNMFWFSRWEAAGFGRLSTSMDVRSDARFYHLREAPDGSLWAVGKGVVVRWAYQNERWQDYPQLPKIVGSDLQGRMWFARSTNVVVGNGNDFQVLPPGELVGWNENGTALIWEADRLKLAVTDPQDPSQRTPLDIKLSGVDMVRADGGDGFWIVGRAQTNELRLAHYRQGKTLTLAESEFKNRRVMAATSALPGQLWVVAQAMETTQYGLALVTDGNVEWQPLNPAPPPITYGNWLAGAGRHWLSGYAGLYEQVHPPTGDWQQVTNTVSQGFSEVLASSNEILFIFSGGPSGTPGAALFSSNRWQTIYGDYSNPTYAKDKQKMFIASRNGVYIRKMPGTLALDHLRMPGGSRVHLAVENRNGDLWLDSADGILRYRPSRIPPQPQIVANTAEVTHGRLFPVVFSSLSRFERQSQPSDFWYSWRVDDQAWSPFEPWRQAPLKLPDLRPGPHRLEVKSRDADGNISVVTAQLPFTVLPMPLQQRAWFFPLLALGVFALVWLGGQRIAHGRKIAATNAILRQEIAVRRQTEAALQNSHQQLEQRVRERTAELTQANESLNREIHERQQAEESRRQMEEQLHQAQKMEAIGTLAGGIAHDFNNVLAVIMLYCQIIQDEIPNSPELKEHLEEVLKATKRAKNLVQQILTFSRQQQQEYRVMDLQPVVKEAFTLLRSVLPSTIQMVERINPAPSVLADPTQIHQVVMNLCVNAQHALENRPGLIEIRLEAVAVDAALCECNPDLQLGSYSRLSVRDTGHGMAPDTLKRVFEPFFTTKAPGQGTGLGLAVVHGIVKNCQGAILIQSQPKAGTEVQIYFPAQMNPAKGDTEIIVPPRPTKGAHILIVDDEVAIAKVLERFLVKNGYQVTTHTSPMPAWEAFQAHPADFDLMLTDFTMPGMNGLELVQKISKLRSDFPVIIATGFGGDLTDQPQTYEHGNIRKIVQKPFSPQAMLRLISEILTPAVPQ